MQVHQRLLDGLAGETLLVAAGDVPGQSCRSREVLRPQLQDHQGPHGGRLDTATSERALRAARVTMSAAQVLGSYEAARAYMHTPNFALGGATPVALIKTADGERIALDELHAQAEGAPL